MREFLDYLIVSYNIWFTVPPTIVFLLALFRLVIRATDFGDADVDAEVNVDMDADGDMDSDKEADPRLRSPFFRNVFGFLNVGRAPLIVVVTSLFLTWGIVGLVANALLNVPEKPQWVWISFVTAFFCSFLGSRYISIVLSKLFPKGEKNINDVHQLLGLSGRVISGQVTTTFGTARVQVPDGPELTVSCRAKSDEATPVKGDTVILVDYDHAKRIFDVRRK